MRKRDVVQLCYGKKRDIYRVVGGRLLFRDIENYYINSVIFLFFTVSSYLLQP